MAHDKAQDNGLMWLLLIGAAVFIFLMIMMSSCKSEKMKFDNSMYQYYPPGTDQQNDYYKCLQNECGGNTYDYFCTEKCHLKTFRKGMFTNSTAGWDAQTWVCSKYLDSKYGDDHAFYRCLDAVYADYKMP